MSILTRYVTFEILKVFLVALTALTMLMMIVGMAREAREYGLGPAQIFLLTPYILPDALRFTIPGTILFAVCSVYGRMAGSNEIVALKSLGISPMAVIWPGLLLACLLSLGTTYINDLAVSWGKHGVRKVAIASIEEIVYRRLRTQRSFTSRDFTILVQGVEGHKLIRPNVTFKERGDESQYTLTADEAELYADVEENLLTFTVRNARIQGSRGEVYLDDEPIQRPLDAGVDDETSYPSWMPMRIIPREREKTTARITRLEETNASELSWQLMTGDFVALANPSWAWELAVLQNANEHLNKLKTEPHRRWANGFSCLCFVLIGAPMAIWRRNADFLTSFFACFLPILLLYYPLLALGVGRAKAGDFPGYSVWLGNVIIAALGALLLRKIIRY